MHDSFQTQQPAAATSDESAPRPPANAGRWLVVLAAAILVIGPILGTGLHEERAKWCIAAGLEHWLDGDLSAALADLDAAAELAPDEIQVYLLRAQWRIYAGDYAGALADAQRVLEAAPGNERGAQLKGDALVYLGRSAEAAKLWADFAAVPESQYDSADPSRLNSVAYYRALGMQDLDTAWAEINAALNQLSRADEQTRNSDQWRSAQISFLDTRGYLRFLRGDLEAAVEDLNSAVTGAEMQRRQQQLQMNMAVRMGAVDPRAVVWSLKEVDRLVAVIRYHRAMALESLGRTDEAAKDLRRVRELGFEPGPKLF